jgi:hypothetical protein
MDIVDDVRCECVDGKLIQKGYEGLG